MMYITVSMRRLTDGLTGQRTGKWQAPADWLSGWKGSGSNWSPREELLPEPHPGRMSWAETAACRTIRIRICISLRNNVFPFGKAADGELSNAELANVSGGSAALVFIGMRIDSAIEIQTPGVPSGWPGVLFSEEVAGGYDHTGNQLYSLTI